MHDKLVLNKVETVRHDFIWMVHHISHYTHTHTHTYTHTHTHTHTHPHYDTQTQHIRTFFVRESGQLVDVFTRVHAVGHTEAKVEVKALHAPVPEEVPLNHLEVFHWLVSHPELHTGIGENRGEGEGGGGKMIFKTQHAKKVVNVLAVGGRHLVNTPKQRKKTTASV